METNNVDSPARGASSPAASASAGQGSHTRLLILLGVLVVALAALAYDHFVAKPGVLAAYDKIQNLVDDQNAKAAVNTTRLTSEVIQQEIGKAPTKRITEEDFTVEYYCWWGPVPFLNTYRQYITVVFVGDEPRRVNSHHMNEYPPPEMLSPAFWDVTQVEGDAAGGEGGEADAIEPPMMMPGAGGPGGEGGGKKGKKKKAADESEAAPDAPPAEGATDATPAQDPTPAEDAPAEDAPAPADTPAVEPAEAGEPGEDANP